MKRTTITISDELDTKLRHIAALRDGTLSDVILDRRHFSVVRPASRRVVELVS